jgi:cyclopropane fatty-acyl-phospholipid synthase-like methyltransferase
MKKRFLYFLACNLLVNVINTNAVEYNHLYKPILETYGSNNLAEQPPFQGGYINFGYWKGIFDSNKSYITIDDRIKASFALYKLIIDNLNIESKDRVLEVGCGLGYGCKYVAENYHISNLTCIDITPQQIERAKTIHKQLSNNINFEVSSADSTNKPSGSYSKIYSVEAAQYFPSMSNFAKEAFRLLEPNGRLVLTAHFSTNQKGYEATKRLLPTVAQDIDRMIPISEVRQAFKEAGFHELKIESIGQYVFQAFDQWISQVEDAPWAQNIYKLYLDGHIDYYVLVLQKSR